MKMNTDRAHGVKSLSSCSLAALTTAVFLSLLLLLLLLVLLLLLLLLLLAMNKSEACAFDTIFLTLSSTLSQQCQQVPKASKQAPVAATVYRTKSPCRNQRGNRRARYGWVGMFAFGSGDGGGDHTWFCLAYSSVEIRYAWKICSLVWE